MRALITVILLTGCNVPEVVSTQSTLSTREEFVADAYCEAESYCYRAPGDPPGTFTGFDSEACVDSILAWYEVGPGTDDCIYSLTHEYDCRKDGGVMPTPCRSPK